jgi:hypothetical protein
MSQFAIYLVLSILLLSLNSEIFSVMFAEKAVTEAEYRTSWHLFPIFNLNFASLSASLFKKLIRLG